jgi:hypothetical protein
MSRGMTMADMGKLKPIDARYVTLRIWDEADFSYRDSVINLGRSGVTYEEFMDLHHYPPLVYVSKERVL